jgi:hypothetical protein
MNNKIKELTNQLEEIQTINQTTIDTIKDRLQAEYNKVFNDSKQLATALSNADQASMYQMDANGEVDAWFRFAGLSDYAECKEYFEAWLFNDYAMNVDWNNDCILVPQGPAIIINEDGDVLDQDSGKWIINRKDYNSTKELNEKIETWMEEKGYFPGVFSVDRYGNVFHVNTKDGI